MSLLQRFADSQPPNRRHRRYSQIDSDDEMGFFSHPSSSAPFLSAPPPPARKPTQASARPRDDLDDFLSSDLELSFASTVSLNSPPPESKVVPSECESMDISPVPFCKIVVRPKKEGDHGVKPPMRPRAYTSAARTFGDDLSNDAIVPTQPPTSQKWQPKRTQRAALPSEWFMSSRPKEETVKENDPQMPLRSPGWDAMDVDSEASAISKQFYPPVPHSAAPNTMDFNSLFHDPMSPRLSLDSSPDSQPKKRRSVSPHVVHAADDSILSSPAPPSSPSQRKLERISSGPVMTRFTKPALQGLGNPQTIALKRPRRLALSVVMQPSEPSPNQCTSADVILSSNDLSKRDNDPPPTRRAFSALLPPTGFMPIEQLSDESSFDGPDTSSPAQAYLKRQSAKTLRRCDGTEDFRPLTGAAAIVQKDHHYESPRSKYLAPGLGGFGDNEAHGKILPCHRVKEDGLMRIRCQTLDDLLDGGFDQYITNYLIVDCRFEYEYDGGHIKGAINVKSPAALEELLLGAGVVAKPAPCISGDATKKTILIFHCEFSAKRAPTFAKQFRSRDRAMNNHVYPNIHFPEVYILEGGYCQYFKHSASRCEPPGYVPMDDPRFVVSRNEDMDQFRKAKFGRYKSYAYGDGPFKALSSQQLPQPKRNSAPTSGPVPLFAAANAARTRRGGLSSLPEDGNSNAHSDNEDTDIGDSPCPPPNKVASFKTKKLGRGSLARAETHGSIRMAY